MNVQALLFDKDGTLFSFSETWSLWAERFLEELADGDRAFAFELGRRIGVDIRDRSFDPGSIVIAGTPFEIAQELASTIDRFSADELCDRMNSLSAEIPVCEVVPLVPLFDGFRARALKLGVATNDSEATARANLDRVDLTHKFDFVAGSDSGFGGKPEPGMLFGFADAVGVVPERAAMVGDSTHDLIAGRAAGMRTVGVLTGLATQSDLSPYADVVLPDIGHLPAWLDSV